MKRVVHEPPSGGEKDPKMKPGIAGAFTFSLKTPQIKNTFHYETFHGMNKKEV